MAISMHNILLDTKEEVNLGLLQGCTTTFNYWFACSVFFKFFIFTESYTPTNALLYTIKY